jgi:CheY-like chemotaxis protein
VLFNIVQNAQHAMSGRGSGRIAVRTRGNERIVRVEISDDGPGIPAEYLKRVFDPFFTTKEVGKGTGLGLSLAYSTVKEHGGSMRVESAPGRGAVFTIELPAQDGGAGARADEASGVETQPGGGGDGMPPVKERGSRILVVEDEKPLADVMVEILQAYGHVIDTAGDGVTAWSMIQARDYDLIITDLKMPNMGGREFYARVAKAKPELARRIIFSTGDTASSETRAFFKEVDNPCLKKPFNLAELVRLVDSALTRD